VTGETPPPPTEGIPRWVKLGVIIVVALVLLIVVLLVSGTGDHGPRRHGSALGASTTHLERSP
jgi:hypothetical protein